MRAPLLFAALAIVNVPIYLVYARWLGGWREVMNGARNLPRSIPDHVRDRLDDVLLPFGSDYRVLRRWPEVMSFVLWLFLCVATLWSQYWFVLDRWPQVAR
jgi:hypothetical protein